MEFIHSILNFFLHIDTQLMDVIQTYGTWTYGILFLVIFCETGLVVTPFLPGDSLLFAAGAFAGSKALRIEIVYPLLVCASVCGDSLNYTIGRRIGARILKAGNSKILKPKYVEKTQSFYDKYGAKTMVIARFIPFVRTFAPFMAGVGKMAIRRFLFFIILGALLWVSVFVLIGYGFGQYPLVQKHFSMVVLGIIATSVLPGLIEYIRHLWGKPAASGEKKRG